jgi:shikimate kinase
MTNLMTELLQGLNLYLIGMMGTGKTTIGYQLAQQLGYRFFDTDVLIERVTGQTIKTLFAELGEENFRALESQVLGEVAACTRSVIATGGGIVLRSKNWGLLRHGLIIWLDAPIALLVERLKEDQTRPLLAEEDLATKLITLSAQRQHLYAEADLHIKIVDNQTPEEIITNILTQLPTVLISSQISQAEQN